LETEKKKDDEGNNCLHDLLSVNELF